MEVNKIQWTIVSNDDSDEEVEVLDDNTMAVVQRCYDSAKENNTHYSEALIYKRQRFIAYYDGIN